MRLILEGWSRSCQEERGKELMRVRKNVIQDLGKGGIEESV
jgi:hypothetical protein